MKAKEITGHRGIGPAVHGIALAAADNFSTRYDLDRDRENDPGLEDTPLSKYIAERKRRLMERLLEAQGVPCPDRSRGPSETEGV